MEMKAESRDVKAESRDMKAEITINLDGKNG